MKKLNPILIVVFVAAAVAIIGYAYVVFGDRYFKKTPNEKIETKNVNQNSILDNLSGYLGGQDDQTDENQNANANANDNANNSNTNNSNTNASAGLPNIASKDCDNRCADYTAEADKNYCLQVCGLSSVQIQNNNNNKDCNSLSGLDKDYCLKDLGISKKDFVICNQIQDSKVKKVCKDRITEDLIN